MSNKDSLSETEHVPCNDDQKAVVQQEAAPQESDATNDELLANAMTGDKIKELLSAEGPTVQAVLLKTDGSAQQVAYDSTPSRNHVADILGAPPSIIGQYLELDLIVVGPRYVLRPEEFPRNEHKLRYPFNNDTFHGDIFLYRFDKNCVVRDFTLSEYEQFASKIAEDDGKVFEPTAADPQPADAEAFDAFDAFDDAEDAEAFDAHDFMREIIVKKVRSEFPAKFGREPSDEELEQYVAMTMQAAAGMLGGGAAMDGIAEEDDDDDDEYDPLDDRQQALQDEIEDQRSGHELDTDRDDIEAAKQEEEAPLRDIDEAEERRVLSSDAFHHQMEEALLCVESAAKEDKHRILEMARAAYKEDTGEEPTDEMLASALQMFRLDGDEEAAERKEDGAAEQEVDPDLFAKEMSSALDNIKRLGREHQAEFVQKLSDTFSMLNGGPPTEDQISSIFGRIKEQLAAEAKQDFLERRGPATDDDDDDDSEYRPSAEAEAAQRSDDETADAEEERNEAVEAVAAGPKVKILVTPVKRRQAGSRLDIYLRQQPEDENKKALEAAKAKFEKVHGKAPTEEDQERLREFMTTGMLFESEVNAKAPDEDDEGDSDYEPAKGAHAHSGDLEDDLAADPEQENEDTSNLE